MESVRISVVELDAEAPNPLSSQDTVDAKNSRDQATYGGPPAYSGPAPCSGQPPYGGPAAYGQAPTSGQASCGGGQACGGQAAKESAPQCAQVGQQQHPVTAGACTGYHDYVQQAQTVAG